MFLSSNICLHEVLGVWFEKEIRCRLRGTSELIRYADDGLVHCRSREEAEQLLLRLKDRFAEYGLELHPENTRIVYCKDDDRKEEHQEMSIDFLGFTFRFDRDLRGRAHRYLNIEPSKKAQQRERDRLKEMTGSGKCYKPVTDMIDEINGHLLGWANYFKYGYPRKAFRKVNSFVRQRLTRQLQRRSQRPMRPPRGTSYYKHLKNLGLVYL